MPIDEYLFRATLITKGRITQNPHSVILRGVKFQNKIYFSRHKPNSDWFKNAIENPSVIIKYKNGTYQGFAKMVTDEKANKKISHLKYPGESRANESRVSIEVTLDE